jgi:hypothetical protein
MRLMTKELQKLRKEDKNLLKKHGTQRAKEKSSTNVVETQRPMTSNMNAASNQIRNRV